MMAESSFSISQGFYTFTQCDNCQKHVFILLFKVFMQYSTGLTLTAVFLFIDIHRLNGKVFPLEVDVVKVLPRKHSFLL